jgi:hypothetical protein
MGFFVDCYGAETVFQNEKFLKWYFTSPNENNSIMDKCIISITNDNQIISFYGGLERLSLYNDNSIPFVWGVNAYTLPEWRGKGLNGGIVRKLMASNEINGVMGMNFKTAKYYEKLGYNMFNLKTLDRYVLLLNNESFSIIKSIGQDDKLARDLLPLFVNKIFKYDKNIIRLNEYSIEKYLFNFEVDVLLTNKRNKNFIKYRFINNPFVDYRTYAYLYNNEIVGYVSSKIEILHPYKFSAYRIIDIYGNEKYIDSLLKYIINDALQNDSLYIDFSVFGNLYNNTLTENGFIGLQNDYVSLLPQLTSPIENRSNHGFLGLQSIDYNKDIMKLDNNNVYFTRVDSDSDRLNRLSQIPH